RLHRVHAEAVRLHAAVAAALAHGLVDDHAHGRVRQLAALAQPPLLRRAALVVDERRDPGDLAQHLLCVVEPIAVPDLDALGPAHAARVLAGLVGHHDDALDALGLEVPRHLGYRHGAGGVLAARHRHGGVVEDLVGDVGASGHRLANGQRARVEER